MATVYMGRDIQSGDPVAVKLLKPEIIAHDPQIIERFAREGEALRRLNHPNIVKALAAFEDDDEHFVVMEYVGGGDLRNLLDNQRREAAYLSIERALDIALDLSDALTRAHRLKIIHRDIKPANVLMTRRRRPASDRLWRRSLWRRYPAHPDRRHGWHAGLFESGGLRRP